MTRYVFGVDTQLVADQTYFVIEKDGRLAACGGWSKRSPLFGADRTKQGADLLQHCSDAAAAGGFHTLELAATMPGVPLYTACGFEVVQHMELDLPGEVKVPLAKMRKAIKAA